MPNRLHQWRRWIRPLVMLSYSLVIIVALPLMLVEFHRRQTERDIQFFFIGGLFVLLALPISLWGILQHLVHYTQPSLQRYIIRILWMVPIYAVNAWLAMRFTNIALYLDTARECYEAYVIYNFMAFLLSFLRIEHADLESHLESKPQLKHLPPVCCLPPWRMGSDLVQKCRHGVLQYTVVRPVTTAIAFICALVGKDDVYGEGQFSFKSAWLYLLIVNNVSQIFAMYCLILFYKATREELAALHPISKFMCVKAVVFLSFWQAVLIAILSAAHAIPPAEGSANQIQDFCICIEMFVAAVAHYFSFSYRPYVDPAAVHNNCISSFWSMWDVSDVQQDVADHLRHVGKSASVILTRQGRPGRPGHAINDDETLSLLSTNDSNESLATSQRVSSQAPPDLRFGAREHEVIISSRMADTSPPLGHSSLPDNYS